MTKVKNYGEAAIKVFSFCPFLVDFFTLFQIFQNSKFQNKVDLRKKFSVEREILKLTFQ